MSPMSILWEVTATLVFALAAARLARRHRAAVRHVILASAFAVALILPFASMIAPSIRIEVPAAVHAAIVPFNEPVADVVDPAVVSAAAPREAVLPARWSQPPAAVLLPAIWAIGACLFLVPIVIGLWQVHALRRSGLPWRQGRDIAAALAADAGIERRVDVLLHESVAGPMTYGITSAVVLLPVDSERWTREDLRRAIVHELEHVRRGDWLTQCLARVVCACYWFHPCVWIVWRQLVVEAERACDDAVLRRASADVSQASEATEYADQLVVLAQRLSALANQPQLAMASRRDLSTRITAVLDSRQARGRAGKACLAIASAACAVIVIALSTLRLVASVPAVPPDSSSAGHATFQSPARFETASIKPCTPAPEDPVTSRGRGAAGGTNAAISPGRFTVPCVTVEQLIYLAHASYGARDDERLANDYLGTASDDKKIRGGPSWIHSYRDRYAIEATAPGVTDRYVLMGTMLRSLLADRFKLKLHRESETVPMYALRVAKGGLKLKPMSASDCDPPAPGERSPCGFMTNSSGSGLRRLHYVGFQLSFLARQLAGEVGRHVIDETGITGEFTIDLTFAADTAAPAGEPADAGTSLFKALGDQLGLTLEKVTGPQGFIVVDQVERPAPDITVIDRSRTKKTS